jgi:hypothetical protein
MTIMIRDSPYRLDFPWHRMGAPVFAALGLLTISISML